MSFVIRVLYEFIYGFTQDFMSDFYNRLIVYTALSSFWDLPMIVTFLVVDFNNLKRKKERTDSERSQTESKGDATSRFSSLIQSENEDEGQMFDYKKTDLKPI
jgi:hypothetical protein